MSAKQESIELEYGKDYIHVCDSCGNEYPCGCGNAYPSVVVKDHVVIPE